MNNERRRESREPTQVQRLFRQLVREWLWISLLLLPLTGLLSFNAETSHRNGSGAWGALFVCLSCRLCPGFVVATPKAGALVDPGRHELCAAGKRRVSETGLVVVPHREPVGDAVWLPDLELAALECGIDLFLAGSWRGWTASQRSFRSAVVCNFRLAIIC